MLIKCKLFRVGGTKVELGKGKGKRLYHFKPEGAAGLKGPELAALMEDPDQDHVCDVADIADIGTLLAIPEAYEVHDSVVASPAAKAAVKQAAAKAPAKDSTEKAATKPYSSLKKPDLIKRIVEHPNFTGKTPHGTTPTDKLIAQLEELDGKPTVAE